MDESEYCKELLELERRYYDKLSGNNDLIREYGKEICETQKFYLTLLSGFLIFLGVLMNVLKIWS